MANDSRTVVETVVTILVVLLVLPLLWGGVMMGGMMGPWMMGPGMMGGWGGGNAWWGVLSMVFSLVVLAGAGLLLVWGWQRFGARAASASSQHPLDVLKHRYARGEITREQYEQIRQDLER